MPAPRQPGEGLPCAGANAALLARWQRMQMHVRCGLSAHLPGSVRVYLHAGLQVARQGLLPAHTVHLRLLNTLLRTAQDEALPWYWRSVCLEHVSLPLAHATTLLARHDPVALGAVEAAVQMARDTLPLGPGGPCSAKPSHRS